eukprot:3124214-Amphidinium_carterae.1
MASRSLRSESSTCTDLAGRMLQTAGDELQASTNGLELRSRKGRVECCSQTRLETTTSAGGNRTGKLVGYGGCSIK